MLVKEVNITSKGKDYTIFVYEGETPQEAADYVRSLNGPFFSPDNCCIVRNDEGDIDTVFGFANVERGTFTVAYHSGNRGMENTDFTDVLYDHLFNTKGWEQINAVIDKDSPNAQRIYSIALNATKSPNFYGFSLVKEDDNYAFFKLTKEGFLAQQS